MATVTISSDDPTDRWRWRCPRGHTSWEPTNHHFWCAKCANTLDVDPEFDELVDVRTREHYQRDEVRIRGYKSKTG